MGCGGRARRRSGRGRRLFGSREASLLLLEGDVVPRRGSFGTTIPLRAPSFGRWRRHGSGTSHTSNTGASRTTPSTPRLGRDLREVSIAKWRCAVLSTAARAGLLICGDVCTATHVLSDLYA